MNTLNLYKKNVYSQSGEDGVIEYALSVIEDTDCWCVEFGAWDGKHLSNTCNLIEAKGYNAILIEGDVKKYEVLKQNFIDNKKVHPVCRFVRTEGKDSLDDILSQTPITKKFDILSIDVDGVDYHIWAGLKVYRPKLICIEFNSSMDNDICYIQPNDFSVGHGNSPLALVELGKQKGYELICVTGQNVIFCDKCYYHCFGLEDNSLSVLREDYYALTKIYIRFDGVIVPYGYKKLPWHGIEFDARDIQVLPSYFRTSPYAMSKFKRKMFEAVYLRLRNLYRRFSG